MKSIFSNLLCIVFSINAMAQQPFLPVLQPDSTWVFIDKKGKEVLKPTIKASNYDVFYDGLAAAQDKTTKLFGYINEKGVWAIKPIYTFVAPFNDGLAVVGLPCDANCYKGDEGLMLGGYTQIIDKKGKTVLKDNSQDERPYARWWFDETYNEDGLLRAIHGLSVGDIKTLMNRKGQMVGSRSGMCCLYLSDGWIAYNDHNGHFYTDKNDKRTLDAKKYSSILPFHEGYAWVQDTASNYILIDKKGKELHTFSGEKYIAMGSVSEGIFAATGSEVSQYYKIDGKLLLQEQFQTANAFSNGLAHVMDAKYQHFYINTKGERIITIKNAGINQTFMPFKDKNYALIESAREDSRINEITGFVLRTGEVFLKY